MDTHAGRYIHTHDEWMSSLYGQNGKASDADGPLLMLDFDWTMAHAATIQTTFDKYLTQCGQEIVTIHPNRTEWIIIFIKWTSSSWQNVKLVAERWAEPMILFTCLCWWDDSVRSIANCVCVCGWVLAKCKIHINCLWMSRFHCQAIALSDSAVAT